MHIFDSYKKTKITFDHHLPFTHCSEVSLRAHRSARARRLRASEVGRKSWADFTLIDWKKRIFCEFVIAYILY